MTDERATPGAELLPAPSRGRRRGTGRRTGAPTREERRERKIREARQQFEDALPDVLLKMAALVADKETKPAVAVQAAQAIEKLCALMPKHNEGDLGALLDELVSQLKSNPNTGRVVASDAPRDPAVQPPPTDNASNDAPMQPYADAAAHEGEPQRDESNPGLEADGHGNGAAAPLNALDRARAVLRAGDKVPERLLSSLTYAEVDKLEREFDRKLQFSASDPDAPWASRRRLPFQNMPREW